MTIKNHKFSGIEFQIDALNKKIWIYYKDVSTLGRFNDILMLASDSFGVDYLKEDYQLFIEKKND